MKRREMIVLSANGRPVLAGRELRPGAKLEVKLVSEGMARWCLVELVSFEGRWLLALPRQTLFGPRSAILAIGQLARFPFSGETRKPPIPFSSRSRFSPLDEFGDFSPDDEA